MRGLDCEPVSEFHAVEGSVETLVRSPASYMRWIGYLPPLISIITHIYSRSTKLELKGAFTSSMGWAINGKILWLGRLCLLPPGFLQQPSF